MDPRMGKRLQRTNMVAILLAGAGVFYQLVAIHPDSRRSAWNKERASATSPELEQCVAAAGLIHDISWASACMLVAEEAEVRHADCLKDSLVMGSPQLGKEHCDKTYGPSDDSPECTLPPARAATLNAQLKGAEDSCLEEARAKSRLPWVGNGTAPGG